MFTTFSIAEAALAADAKVTTIDVGANNTRDALFGRGRILGPVSRVLTVPPGESNSRELFVHRVRTRIADDRPDAVVIGAAGPVNKEGVIFTNNGLVIDYDEITRVIHAAVGTIPVILANDALCGAAGLLALPKDLFVQFNGQPHDVLEVDEITVAILGTGLGVARLVRIGDRWVVKPSELGHLWARSGSSSHVDGWMRTRYGSSLELEDYASGLGIANITQALIESTPRGVEVARAYAIVPDKDKARYVAGQAKRHDGHPLFKEAMRLFREQVGFATSTFGMNFSSVVLAGRPVTANLDYLLADGVLGNAISHRHKMGELARHIRAYAVQESSDPGLGELNLLGAGLIGTMAL